MVAIGSANICGEAIGWIDSYDRVNPLHRYAPGITMIEANATYSAQKRARHLGNAASSSLAVTEPVATSRHGVAGAVIGNRFCAVSGDVQSSGTGVAFEFK